MSAGVASVKQSRYRHPIRNLAIASSLIALCLATTHVLADQSDPRLDRLFIELQDAGNPVIAKRAEAEIWTIWHDTPDQRSLEIMRNARRALDSGKFPDAIELLNELVEYAPGYAEAWNQRAIVLYIAEDYAGSLRDIEQALALEPRHFGALSGRGQVYLQLQEWELALQSFELALNRNPWMDNIRGQMEMIKARINSRPKPI